MHPDDTPCDEWPGSRFPNGYGYLRIDGRTWLAHRWAWTQANGPIPPGLQVLHRCDNRACRALSHLFLGTQSDNIQDMYAKGRGTVWTEERRQFYRERFPQVQRRAVGEKHGCAKLTEAQVYEIRARFEPYVVTKRMLAVEYGVAMITVKSILSRRLWKHLS